MAYKEPDITYNHIDEEYSHTILYQKSDKKRIIENETVMFLFEEAIILSMLLCMFYIL